MSDLGPAVRTYQPADGWFKTLVALLAINGLLEFATMWALWLELELLKRWGQFTAAEAEANDSRVQLVFVLELIVSIAYFVVLLLWLRRGNHNARALGSKGMEFTPGWIIGWWFVPFANLVKPYQAVRELWLASVGGRDWKMGANPGLLPFWWAAWLISSVVSTFAGRRREEALVDAESIASNDHLLVAAAALTLVSLVLTYLVVSGIRALQEARHKRIQVRRAKRRRKR